MGQQVVKGAILKCSFGSAPSSLMVIPKEMPVEVGGQPAATIMDFAPIANILPFGMCNSPANPMVIAAMLTPMPCNPVTVAPWSVGSPTVKINNFPALNNASKCKCNWGGVISIKSAGQTQTQIP